MDSPIAIVGIGLRLPGGCHDTASFWDLLVNKRDALRDVPPERFNIDGFYTPKAERGAGSLSVRQGYFLNETIDRFDAGFFSMSQAEVERLDPQQRLLLEVVYEALENAGETDPRNRNVGVYAGSFGADWAQMQGRDLQDESVYGLTGYDDFVHANRVSYEFDLHGPSMTIKVGCSSGLVALHLACEALQRGDCSGAVVCAANLFPSPDMSTALEKMGVLSADGSSKSFDASADGYARGEAVNAVYIKRLDDALRDQNPIRAIIRGTAVNADGKTRGLFTPSPEAHTSLIQRAYSKAGILSTHETPFVECHSTGTKAGDPLELAAIARVFGGEGEETKGTYIGSVKPNIGHGEAAAGLSSLIKAVLSLEKQVIPPNIKFHTPNPKIPFKEGHLSVPTEGTAWPKDRVKRVSVNSFGMGGANAHVIVDAPPPTSEKNGIQTSMLNGIHAYGNDRVLANSKSNKSEGEQRLLVFSAQSERSLQDMVSNYKKFVTDNSFHLSDLAYTLSVKRHHWTMRSFCVSNGKTFQTVPGVRTPKLKGLLFIFTGQGAQWPGMGRDLLRDFSTFRDDIRKMDSWLAVCAEPPSWKIEGLLRDYADINSPEFSQPICTALQLALVNLLRKWNVLPTAVVGHSSGEIAAAYAAGALGMREALLISYYRGVAASELRQQGAMAAVGLSRDDAESFLIGNAVVACENSRSSVTISGNTEDVEASLERVSKMRPEVLARKLKINRAYHSAHMKEVSKRYMDLMASIAIKPTQGKLSTLFFSSVTGSSTYDAASLGYSYWISNMENPVLFLSAVESLLRRPDKCNVALEIGPHSTLSGPFRQICLDMEEKVQYISTLARGSDCTTSVLTALGQLYCHGVVPHFAELNPPGATMSNLPPYPWNHDTIYWHESRISREFRQREYPEHELLGTRVVGGNDLEPSWRKLLDVNNVSWINDHVIFGDVIFPGAGYIGIIGEAIRQLSKLSSFTIRDFSIKTAIILHGGQPTEINTRLHPHGVQRKPQSSNSYDFTISSYDGNKWHTHCSGEVYSGQPLSHNLCLSNLETIRKVESADWYGAAKAVGLEYGSSFRGLQNIQSAVGGPIASAEVYDSLPVSPSYPVHPIAIDQLLQCAMVGSVRGQLRNMNKLILPIHIGELHIEAQEVHTDLQLRTQVTSHSEVSISANGQIQARNGSVILQCEKIQFRTLDSSATNAIDSSALHKLHLLEWKPDIDLIDVKTLLHRTTDMTSCISLVEKLYILCSIETTRILKNVKPSLPHLQRFKEWIEEYVTTIKRLGSPVVRETDCMFLITSEERQDHIQMLLEEALETQAKDMALAVASLYDAVEDIFNGKTEALSVLMADDLLTRCYNFLNMVDHEQFLQLLGHSNPDMNILEIGAGTGGFTSSILSALHKPSFGSLFDTYTFTDISSSFFKAAKQRFQNYSGLKYVELDISQETMTQGLPLHSYDLVIASNVLHATPNLHKTLSNCRSLLRPSGRLLLLELSTESKFINFIFGFLPGWWLGESDGRANEPYIKPEQWDIALRKAGFAGIEASITDQPSPCQLNTMMIARASDSKPLYRKPLSLLVADPSVANEHVEAIQSKFESDGYDVSLCSLTHLPSNSTDIVSLLEMDIFRPFFKDLSEKSFKGLIHLVEQCYNRGSKILWVMGPAQIFTQNPYHAMVLGLARTIRLEMGSVFATLELDANGPGPLQYDSISKVLKKLQTKGSFSYGSMDCEFAVANGNICVPRFLTSGVDELLRKNMDSKLAGKRLFIKTPGLLDTLQWGLQSRAPVLRDDEVEVEVKTASLSPSDYAFARGTAQSNRNLGSECAGVICRIGANTTHSFHLGDRVLCWTPGSLSTHVRVNERYCIKLPETLPFNDALTLSTAHAAMIRGLVELCNLAPSESVLIHSAASAAGIAAIEIARTVEANIFVTAATEEQKVFLKTKMGIPSSQIFSSNDDSSVHTILQATDCRGVDAVVNIQSDDLSYESWKCIADAGSILDLTQRGSNEKRDRSLTGGNQSLYSFDMVTLLQQKPSVAHRLLQTVLKYYNDGLINLASPMTKFHPEEIKEAFHHLPASRRIGSAYIQFPQDPTTLTADFAAPEELKFRADRAFLLVGGLGGLGRSASMYLAERGARHIIFLSPSASKHAAAHSDFLRELESIECSYEIVTGSVEDLATVENIVAKSPKPIAGVLHLPVVVRDRGLLEMSHADWTASVSPKVLGAWNLHRALEKQPLDFFLLLGSANGIRGRHGQANYAAANTFLDAFVVYRQQLNLPATIMDLGPVEDIGFLVERPKLLEEFRRGGAMLNENDFLESFHLALQSSHLSLPTPPSVTSGFINHAQFVTGRIERPFDARGQGLARIYNKNEDNDAALGAGQDSSAGKKRTKLQEFMENVRSNPQSLEEDALASEAFLATQILQAAKSLLIFDDGDSNYDDGLDESSSIADLAIDSLLAIELQSWWRQSMGTQISILELTKDRTLLELGKLARAMISAELNTEGGNCNTNNVREDKV